MNSENHKPIRKATTTFIFITVVLDMLGFGIIIPVLPKLILQFNGGDSSTAAYTFGIFGTVFAVTQFFCAPIIGNLSDRFGRRPAILISNFGMGLDYILMALANSMPLLFIGRFISGICSASFSIPSAYIADVTPPEKRAAAFGMLGGAFGIGFVIGPAFGGLLGSFDPRLPFWVAGALSLINATYGYFVLPESLSLEKRTSFQWKKANPIGSFKLLWTHKHVFGLAMVVFISSIAHEILPNLWVLYTDYMFQWDTQMVGYTLAAVGVTSGLVQAVLVGPVVKIIKERGSLILGLAFGAIGFLIYGLAIDSFFFYFGIPFLALWGLAGPTSQSLMSSQVPDTEQGALQGTIAGLQGIAHIIGPLLFTGTFSWAISNANPFHMPGIPFIISSILVFISGILAIKVTKPSR